MSEPVLHLSDVHKSYGWRGRTPVLRGASFAVDRGELVGIVGENGSGKSTLLKVVAGFLGADDGQVRRTPSFGYCPQDPILDPALSPRQHVRYFQAAYRCGGDRALELLERLGGADLADRQVQALSGGTRQKVNLTLALMHDPELLLLDEPYQGFDWETYLAFWGLLDDLRERGCSVVVITHLAFEQSRFDRLLRLRAGRIESGDFEEGSDS